MSLSVTIMAHTARRAEAQRLAQLTGASLSLDDGSLGETANGDRAWAMHQDAEWHLVIQDDALLIDDFLIHAADALAHAPETAVSFYVGTGRPNQRLVQQAIRDADETGAAWLRHNALLWGVAVAMPTAHIPVFLKVSKRSEQPYDRRIGDYWTNQGIDVLYTWPSLADHADGPTLLRHPWGPPTAPRRAHRLGIPSTWDTPVTPMRRIG